MNVNFQVFVSALIMYFDTIANETFEYHICSSELAFFAKFVTGHFKFLISILE